MPLSFEQPAADNFPAGMQPNIRRVDTGGGVIDLAKMKAELEMTRPGRGGELQ